jgi:phosphatidylserine/phosphatidylglycerophosphate/cardiolipin synthase-like enzyme
MMRAAPGRVAIYGIENTAGTPVYVHAKACVVDDTWSTIGSDNFNRRSWTHDSELSAVVLDVDPDGERLRDDGYARQLRLTLAAEHLGRVAPEAAGPDGPALDTVADCVDPDGMFATFEQSAAALDAWHDGGRVGPRPPGRLRRMQPPEMGPLARLLALPAYLVLHDPDGRPKPLRRTDGF